MPKIKVTTTRRPWTSEGPLEQGAEVLVSDAEAEALVANGFAEVIGEAAPKRRAKVVDNPDVPVDQ
jgi:hypothetical protein